MTTILSDVISWIKLLFKSLWSSVSSVQFYQDVFTVYSGYGVKYLLTLCFFSSFVCSIFCLEQINKLRNYFNNNEVSDKVANIEHIINQLPEIEYNGKSISIEESTPMYINNIRDNRIMALDPENKLSYIEKSKIPIFLGGNKITINILDSEGKVRSNIPIEYSSIFGNSPQMLTQEVIKSTSAAILNKVPSLFIYITFPVLFFLIFINALLEKAFVIGLLYMIMRVVKIQASLKDCIRMILFASGIFVFLQPIILFALPELISHLWLLQIWTNILMALGIFRSAKHALRLF